MPGISLPLMFRRCMGGGIAILVTVVPYVYYRWEYADHKRLREVVPGQFYRSGHLTAAGFTEAVKRFNLRTIVNLQDEYPDLDVCVSYLDRSCVKERQLCEQLGVRYVYIAPDLLPPNRVPPEHPRAIDQFLALMDDPATYPVLIHCRAGLHRTGVLTAVYRMEYQGWSIRDAFRELKANGFGESACTSANEYVAQYVLSYRPRRSENIFHSLASTESHWDLGLKSASPRGHVSPTPDP